MMKLYYEWTQTVGYFNLSKVSILLKPQVKGHPSCSSFSNPLQLNNELSLNREPIKHKVLGAWEKQYEAFYPEKKN